MKDCKSVQEVVDSVRKYVQKASGLSSAPVEVAAAQVPQGQGSQAATGQGQGSVASSGAATSEQQQRSEEDPVQKGNGIGGTISPAALSLISKLRSATEEGKDQQVKDEDKDKEKKDETMQVDDSEEEQDAQQGDGNVMRIRRKRSAPQSQEGLEDGEGDQYNQPYSHVTSNLIVAKSTIEPQIT